MPERKASKRDEAIKRRERLQALRQKQKEQSTQGGRRESTGVSEDTKYRRTRLLKFLTERRTRSQEDSTVRATGAERRQILSGLADSAGGTPSRDAILERFPRLQQLLAQGRGRGLGNTEPKVSPSSSPEEISRYREELETRASRLESALKRTLAELDEVRNLEGRAGGVTKAE